MRVFDPDYEAPGAHENTACAAILDISEQKTKLQRDQLALDRVVPPAGTLDHNTMVLLQIHDYAKQWKNSLNNERIQMQELLQWLTTSKSA